MCFIQYNEFLYNMQGKYKKKGTTKVMPSKKTILAARITISAATAVIGCNITAVIVITAEEQQKNDPETATVVTAEESAVVAAATVVVAA